MEELSGIEQHWSPLPFSVVRLESRPENFAFVYHRVLVVGLNLVGGRVHNSNEWVDRLTDLLNWTTDLLMEHQDEIGALVLLGHANPTRWHNDYFFEPLVQYMNTNELPILYVNGDAHVWRVEENFQDRILRVQVTGGTSEPPLKVSVTADSESTFQYDRQL